MGIRHRKQCEANVYHITTRGNSRQVIFEDDTDRRTFGALMRKYLAEHHVELLAWCFMSNHVHLLLHADILTVESFMHDLLGRYARLFNTRHGRSGRLFQERFVSEPVESDEQLLTVVRYIHRNPVEIPGQTFFDYLWSSYREYVGDPFITYVAFVMGLFGSVDQFKAFHEQREIGVDKVAALAGRGIRGARDEDLVAFARQVCGVDSVAEIEHLPKERRNALLNLLKRNGLTIAQIARITGIGRNIIQRA